MKWFKYILITLILASLSTKKSSAQVDTVFWFAAPWVTPDHDGNTQMAFRISTLGTPANVRIQMPTATYDSTFVVPASGLVSIDMSPLVNDIESTPADAILTSGIKITSDEFITVVYDFISDLINITPGNPNNPETYSLKGQNGMGTEFVVPFQTLWNNRVLTNDRNGDLVITQPKQFFSVIATEDNTTIYIKPNCDVVGHPANITYAVNLPLAGNVYTCENVVMTTSNPGSSLSGSIVTSDKPVSVTMNDDSVNPSGGGGCFDLMGDQIVPTDVIGNEYIVNIGGLNAGSNESVFIIPAENFTTVTITDGGITSTLMNQGETWQYSITDLLTHIIADKPVYLIHMSGYGCELGIAILPPLNCAGSDEVSFPRNNNQAFSLNLLCEAGDEFGFTLTAGGGGTGTINPSAFNPVPGTGGAWVGAQIDFNTAEIPSGFQNTISNSAGLFSMGIINGGATSGCLYHYMSSFQRKVITQAGNDTTLCSAENQVQLQGSVTGGTTTGQWQVLNGTGTLNTPNNLLTSYSPSPNDYMQGTLTFVLGSTGNCDPVYDTMKVDFIQSPVVSAGGDASYCKNNIAAVPISGSVQFAAAGVWTGGNGGAFGNQGTLSTTYTPSPADLANDSVILYLTSAGNFFACPNDEDTMVVYFTDPPSVLAGPDLMVCSSESDFTLSGAVSGVSSTGIWTTTGSGAFSPTDTDLNGNYLISSADTAVGSLTIYLTSTNNSNCQSVIDSFDVTIMDMPTLDITTSDSLCSNLTSINLTGTVTAGFSTNWTVLGSGTVVTPGALNTTYTLSPIDTTSGFIQVVLETTGSICPVESDTLTITFVSPPVVNAGLNQSFCENEPIQLNGLVTGANPIGSWASTGTGSFYPSANQLSTIYFPSAADVAAGGIDLILTSAGAFGCTPDDDTLEVVFIAPPTVDFTFTNACAGSNTAFVDQSTAASGTLNSWSWDFGDMSTSIANNPLHPYPGPGQYTATLIVGSTTGCSDTISYLVDVAPNPIASFNNTIACVGQETHFTDQSFISSGLITDWEWNFENGAVLYTTQDASFTFALQGSYPVILTVTSDQGCIDDTTVNITVLPRPDAAFSMSPNPALVLENVDFTDLSTGNQLSQWYWNFGDGTGSNNQNEIYSFADGGDYYVTLTVTDINGCVDSTGQEISIALLPVLPTAFTPNGDGENDVFLIRGGPFTDVDFKIYNNWGELIFSSIDANDGWDGTYKGQNAPLGVYTWTFIVEIAGDRIFNQSGDVTLMR